MQGPAFRRAVVQASVAAVSVLFAACSASGISSTPSVPSAFAGSSPQAMKPYPTKGSLLFVADEMGNVVDVFQQLGAQPMARIGVKDPGALAISPNGTLVVASFAGNAVKLFHLGDRTSFASLAFAKPDGVAADLKNNVYASSASRGVISMYPYDAAKKAVSATPAWTISKAQIPTLDAWSPTALATDSQGNLYVGNDAIGAPCGCVWQLDAGQKPSRLHPVRVIGSHAILAEDAAISIVAVSGRVISGRLLNTYYLNDSVYLPTQSTAQMQLGGPNFITGIAIAKSGNVFVSGGVNSSSLGWTEVYVYRPGSPNAFHTIGGFVTSGPMLFGLPSGIATWN